MHHGICNLSIVPIRILAEDTSEMVTQLLYGDHFKILEKRKYWSKIRDDFDGCEGWVRNNQFIPIPKQDSKNLKSLACSVRGRASISSKNKSPW